MFKKILCVLFAALLLGCFTACQNEEVFQEPVLPVDGIANGVPGDLMRTTTFDFEVTDTKALAQYAQQDPIEGHKYIMVIATITNTTGADITLHDVDFQLLWGTEGFADTMVAWDEHMAPMEATLGANSQVEYRYIYSVPLSVTDFRFCYLSEGAVKEIFYVTFTV